MMTAPLINLIVGLALVGLFALLVWPRRGLIARFRHASHASTHMAREDLLKGILKAEAAGRTVSIDGLAGVTGTSRDQIADLLQDMDRAGLVSLEAGVPKLKPKGRDAALHIVRAHRIWERHLADRTGIQEEQWHDEAEVVEHTLSPQDVRALSAELGNPTVDPHGDPIPAEGADLWSIDGVAITTLDVGDRAQIVHVEDEPPTVYAQLVAESLTPGMIVQVIEKRPERIHFWADGNEVMLAPIVAANVTVRILEHEAVDELKPTVTLRDIKPGMRAQVTNISRGCRGPMRRRLLDLGVVPGSWITVEREAPGGDPVAYRIRGAAIALRESQARFIRVDPESEQKAD